MTVHHTMHRVARALAPALIAAVLTAGAAPAAYGPAVPDDVAAFLRTPGKTLADVPDVGNRAWLAILSAQLKRADAELIAGDVRLLEGKPAIGPRLGTTGTGNATKQVALPTRYMRTVIPWHAVELLMHAARLGSHGVQAELDRLCASSGPGKPHASCVFSELPVIWSPMSDGRMLAQPHNGSGRKTSDK